MLEQCYSSLRVFGSAADSFNDREALFQIALADYKPEQINRAFTLHIQQSVEFPTPSEIIAFIDPWKKKLCPKMYGKLVEKRRKGIQDGKMYPLGDEEEEFISRYENQQLGIY